MGINKRIVALDIGTKRIGVAVSDALWLGATPLKLILRKEDSKAREEIIQICNSYQTNLILIGVPYNMDGTLGFQAKICLNFIKPLEKDFEILYQDERLSSEAAENILKNKGKKYTKNKGLVDTTAAAIILQDYLDSKK